MSSRIAGATLFLGERLHARRIGAVLVGFCGALAIPRPGIEIVDIGAIAQLVAAPLMGEIDSAIEAHGGWPIQ